MTPAFTLPAGFRPAKNAYVPINLCTGSIGRLDIKPTDAMTVDAEGTNNFGLAQCATSLDGASFALSSTSFTALTLKNGWMNAPYGTAKAPFVLPKGFRPAKDVFVTVDLCSGNKGRMNIKPDGVVEVEAENDDFAQAQCFTSLDGASFAR